MHLIHHQFKNVLVLQSCMETKCFIALNMIGCKYSVVAAMQLMEYAPNSPSIQKRFGIAILYGNKMFPSLEYDWMQIVHTPPCFQMRWKNDALFFYIISSSINLLFLKRKIRKLLINLFLVR